MCFFFCFRTTFTYVYRRLAMFSLSRSLSNEQKPQTRKIKDKGKFVTLYSPHWSIDENSLEFGVLTLFFGCGFTIFTSFFSLREKQMDEQRISLWSSYFRGGTAGVFAVGVDEFSQSFDCSGTLIVDHFIRTLGEQSEKIAIAIQWRRMIDRREFTWLLGNFGFWCLQLRWQWRPSWQRWHLGYLCIFLRVLRRSASFVCSVRT